jgi:hypothetical protein
MRRCPVTQTTMITNLALDLVLYTMAKSAVIIREVFVTEEENASLVIQMAWAKR